MGYDLNKKSYSKKLDLTKIAPYGDTLNDGKVQQLSSPDELYEKPQDTLHIHRIINKSSGLIYQINVDNKKYSVISFEDFHREFKKTIGEAYKSNKVKYEKWYKPRKKRSKDHRDRELKKYGFWKDRFSWKLDTLITEVEYINQKCSSFTFTNIGIVNDRNDDTLFISRKIITMNKENSRISAEEEE